MAEPTPAEKNEEWASVGGQFLAGALEALFKTDVAKFLTTNGTDILTELLKVLFQLTVPIGVGFAKGIAEAEDSVAPALAETVAAAVGDAFGADVSPGAFSSKSNRGARTTTAQSLGRGVMNQIAGAGGTIEPSAEGAERYLGMVLNMALEGWYQGFFFEFMSSLVPYFDIGKLESFAELDDTLSQTLGLGRMSRRVLQPLLDAKVITPLRWQVNRTYRPALLSYTEVARQVARGRMTREAGIEELARQGYSQERIEALFNAVRKFHSVADADLLVRAGVWDRGAAVQHLRDQGYDPDTADLELRLERIKRIASFERSMATEAVNAYADRRIERHEMIDFLRGATLDPQESDQLAELADTKRVLKQRHLSPAEAKAAVKAGILSVVDYRRALERDHYTPDAVLTLELLLRHELDEQARIEDLRREAQEERERERAEKAAAAAARRDEIEAERARARRGPIAKLEKAVVRGLIPMSRLAEVLRDEYDADTVGILLDLVESDRLAYVEQQQQREEAAQRAARRGLSVADLERAVLEKILSLADYRKRLEQQGMAAGDIHILAATLAARLAAREEAQRERDEAAARAATRKIDLGRFEQLVRRGARTLAQYDALLAELGFDDASRAGMVQLLELQLADDAAARAQRERAAAELAARGLSLEQFERAVLLGVKSIDEYQTFLVGQRFTADAQMALVGILRERLLEADAARARRSATTDTTAARALPLATIARAARLGVISPDAYVARLEADGYSPDDVAIELELLLLEISEVQAARAARERAELEAQARGLSLADVERAVKLRVASIDDYRARAAELGYSGDALETLMAVLVEELAQQEDARVRREQIRLELERRELNLGQLEALVKDGLKSLDDYFGELQALGYGADDAELLTTLLAGELAATEG